MKTTTQRGLICIAAILSILFAIGLALHAQTSFTETDNGLQPVASSDIPAGSAFFRLSDYISGEGTLGPPWPFIMDSNAAIYWMSGNSYLVDDVVFTNSDDLANALSLLIQPQDSFSTRLSPLLSTPTHIY